MATKGFEFARALDQSVPVMADLPVSGTGAYAVGDAVVFSSGKLTKVTNTVATVSAIIAESRASGTDGGNLRAAIVTKAQVWRVSMDANTTAVALGVRTVDVVDSQTVDADDGTNGSLVLMEKGVDDAGNVLAYVTFSNTTFG